MRMASNIVAVTAALWLPAVASAETFDVDAHHSYVGFKVKHMMVSNVKGRFTQFHGTFELAAQGGLRALTGTVGVASIDTADANRDKHLQQSDFFDASKYPEMRFTLKKYTRGHGGDRMLGTLTLRGVSRPVEFAVEVNGPIRDPHGNVRAGFSATTTINRQDFGLAFDKRLDTGGLMVGNDVRIELEIEGTRAVGK